MKNIEQDAKREAFLNDLKDLIKKHSITDIDYAGDSTDDGEYQVYGVNLYNEDGYLMDLFSTIEGILIDLKRDNNQ